MKNNIIFIEGDIEETVDLIGQSVAVEDKFHCTNGTFAASPDLILGTTLAGFEFLNEKVAGENDIFLIAVNSDASMARIMDKKNASVEERANLEDQILRAMKVAEPLASVHSQRQIFVVFYDDETPTKLYDAMAEAGLQLSSLHKWGYGIDPNGPKIEGAHNFASVYGFPLPNNILPLCHTITVAENQSTFVKVVDLKKYLTASQQLPHAHPETLSPKPAGLG